jgi:endonuclease YncB( thermonuclease family)
VRYLFKMGALLLASTVGPTAPAFADDLSGQATITDGDTVEIHGARIRLWGIDAPESDQLCRDQDSARYHCGSHAANELSNFIARRPIDCIEVDRDQKWGRPVAVCTVAGVDLAEWLVTNGLALDWPRYSKGAYAGPQDSAKRADRGMWRGSFIEPWRYRYCKMMGGRPSECSDDVNGR